MTTKVLICDDSGLARKQMARALPGDWGVETLFAVDGLDGLEKLRAGEAEILFLDLNMPELDGYGVLEAINREDLPVLTVVVSGDIQPQARERVKKMGAIDFIKKPTDPQVIAKLLQDYGLYRPGEEPESGPEVEENTAAAAPAPIGLNEYLQEVSNVAMGRAADLLARLLNVFVKLPVPRVAMIAKSELSMALSAADESSYSAVCQGFIGAGIAGEALLLFSDSSFDDMARLLQYDDPSSEAVQVEVLMDMSSILFGAFLKGLGDQLDLKLGLGHPMVLGQHRRISDLLEHHSRNPEQLLAIEINYQIEGQAISCDLLVLLTEDSIPHLEKGLFYLAG
ncbi:response regulator [Marinobacter sp.]|uniref:response regulator n=1 Tax=Marinobacter sp. TaxID=50741 RepID=UPI00385006B6